MDLEDSLMIEATKRLRMLGVPKEEIDIFQESNVPVYVDGYNGNIERLVDESFLGMYIYQALLEFYEYRRGIPYLIINKKATYILFVSPLEDSWEEDRRDLSNGTPLSFVYNVYDRLEEKFDNITLVPYEEANNIENMSYLELN